MALKIFGIAYYNFDVSDNVDDGPPLKVSEINEYELLKMPLIISHDKIEKYRGVIPGKTTRFIIKNNKLYVKAIIYPEYRHLVEKEGFRSFSISFGTSINKLTKQMTERTFIEISLCKVPVGKECKIISIKSFSNDLENNNIKEKKIIFPIQMENPTTPTNTTPSHKEESQIPTESTPSTQPSTTIPNKEPEPIIEDDIEAFTPEELEFKKKLEPLKKEDIEGVYTKTHMKAISLLNYNKFLDEENKTLKRALEDHKKNEAEKIRKTSEETKLKVEAKMKEGASKKFLAFFGADLFNTPKIIPSTTSTTTIPDIKTSQTIQTKIKSFSEDKNSKTEDKIPKRSHNPYENLAELIEMDEKIREARNKGFR
jgi:hypothetical protein